MKDLPPEPGAEFEQTAHPRRGLPRPSRLILLAVAAILALLNCWPRDRFPGQGGPAEAGPLTVRWPAHGWNSHVFMPEAQRDFGWPWTALRRRGWPPDDTRWELDLSWLGCDLAVGAVALLAAEGLLQWRARRRATAAGADASRTA